MAQALGKLSTLLFSALVIDADFNSRRQYPDIDELAISIASQGVVTPLKVIITPEKTYRVISGHRRYLALEKNINSGIMDSETEIPVIILPKSTSELSLLSSQSMDNDGVPLTMLDMLDLYKKIMAAYKQETGKKLSQKMLANMVGKSITHVNNVMLLDEASDATKQSIVEGKASSTMVVQTIRQKGAAAADNLVSKALETSKKSKVTRTALEEESGEPIKVSKKVELVKLVTFLDTVKQTLGDTVNQSMVDGVRTIVDMYTGTISYDDAIAAFALDDVDDVDESTEDSDNDADSDDTALSKLGNNRTLEDDDDDEA